MPSVFWLTNKFNNIKAMEDTQAIRECDFHDGSRVSSSEITEWRKSVFEKLNRDKTTNAYYIRSGNSLVIGRRDVHTDEIVIFEISEGYKEFVYEPGQKTEA